jgi:hypothetical protein
MNTRSFLLSSLIAGAAIALFGNLPLLNIINCVLCAWVWMGGALSVILYQRFEGGKAPLSAGQGAGLGALSGFIGAVIGIFVFLLTSSLSLPVMNALARALQVQGDIPLPNGGLLENAGMAFGFFIGDAILYPLFGALGAVIAANLTKESRTKVEAVS